MDQWLLTREQSVVTGGEGPGRELTAGEGPSVDRAPGSNWNACRSSQRARATAKGERAPQPKAGVRHSS